MAADPNANKLKIVDYSEVTLEEWLKDNKYSFLAGALSNELGVQMLEDISVVSENDLNTMFDNLKAVKSQLIKKMKAKDQIAFKKKFMQFVRGYVNYLGSNSPKVNNNNNNNNNNKNKNNKNNTAASPILSSAGPDVSFDKLAQNYETTVEFIKQFKNDTASSVIFF